MVKSLWLVPILVTLAACTWVKVTDAGSGVRVTRAEDVTECRKLGSVTTMTKAAIGSIERKKAKVVSETDAIARNEAAKMGGNAIVPTGQLVDGEQEYKVYDCAN